MHRRRFLISAAGSAALASTSVLRANAIHTSVAERELFLQKENERREEAPARRPLKGRINHSACRWCYGSIPLDDLCREAAAMGLKSIELLDEKEWKTPAKYGLTCAMANGPGPIHKGWNRVEHHDELVKASERMLPLVKDANLPNMIVFSGNRAGLSDADGIKNCVAGLKRITPLAEKLGVTLCLELLNSRVDHHDYQCDRTDWGVEVCKGVGSRYLKLLFDIYHVQIMEGDIIRRIRDNIAFIGHFHTGGVPGRGEIDETQELNYRAIAKAIADVGYKGFVAQEFMPTRDPLTSLRQAIEICDA
jgi:hydroxypyruvate isomerase